MHDDKSQGGFTIVETMIVLGITGLVLASAILLVVGQQNKVEFTQSTQDIQSSIQQVISEVNSGFYPNPGNLQCDATGNAVNLSTGTAGQGSNTGCIFVGKALQFGVKDTDPQDYYVHSIAALQNNDGSLASSKPKAIAPGITTNNSGSVPNASLKKQLLFGLQAVSMRYVNGGVSTPISAVAFVSSLGQYAGGQLLSGTQQLSLVPVNGSSTIEGGKLATEPGRVVDAINNNLATSPLNPTGGVEICFASGATNQSGLVTLGSNNRSISVKLDIKSSKDCS